MKTIWFPAVVLLTFSNHAKSEMRDAVTHDQLVMNYRQAQQADPMAVMKKAEGPDPTVVNQPLDLISQSDIICFNGFATLVPKSAILRIPAKLVERMTFQPGSQIQSWADFFAANRGWIKTVEVNRLQAEGNLPLPVETSKQIEKSGDLIVATLQAGPISVLPLKVANQPLTSNPVR